MWKLFLFSLCLQLLFLSIFSLGSVVKAADQPSDGFIIKADKVVGSGMFATIVRQETSTNDGKPMLRIQYKSAAIYGMSLTKEVNSPSGPVSITLKANGPVMVKGMTVDMTAISFQGTCINAAEVIPKIAMENVVMVAHYMDSEESNIDQLLQNIISGNVDGSQPSTLNLLQDLGNLPGKELVQEISKISKGHLPLMCDNVTGDSGTTTKNPIDIVKNPLAPVTKPVEPVINGVDPVLEPVKKPLDPVLKSLNPVLEPVKKPLDPVLKSLDPVLGPIKKPMDPILKPLDPVTRPIDSILKPVMKPLDPVLKPLDPIVSDPPKAVNQTLQSACVNLKEAKGVITKELALKLIDEAIQKKQILSSICQDDVTETKWLQKWNDSLLNSLGLLDLFGILKPEDPLLELQRMRDKVSQAKDEAIIFTP